MTKMLIIFRLLRDSLTKTFIHNNRQKVELTARHRLTFMISTFVKF